MPGKLVRFRVDPRFIRVSVRPEGARFRAWVHLRPTEESDLYEKVATASGMIAAEAIKKALEAAYAYGCEGIDLDMEWVYRHPWLNEDDPDPLNVYG